MYTTNPIFGNACLIAHETAAVFLGVVLVTDTFAAVTTTSLWT